MDVAGGTRTMQGNAGAALAAVRAVQTGAWGWKSLAREKQKASGDEGLRSCMKTSQVKRRRSLEIKDGFGGG